ncbi:MAG: O-antigen ligase family protein [Lachnospiraceae bacterium]|nr:O-antigen ligase family protein [Lachnospiraceae bacterium]
MQTKDTKINTGGLFLLLLTLTVLPFIVHIYSYHLDMEEYSWFILDEDRTDFFSYYKSLFFSVLVLCMAGDLLRGAVNSHFSEKVTPIWLLLIINGGFYLLSAVCSVNLENSLFGSYGRFESVFVLLGYEILCFYAYQHGSGQRVFQLLLYGLTAAGILMGFSGILQISGMDPLTWEWVQRLITPNELESSVLGNITSNLEQNTVYLTLANPNYASIYLSMLMPLIFIQWKTGSKRMKVISTCLLALLFVNLILTFSRVGLLALGSICILSLILRRKSWKKLIPAVLACALLFLAADSLSGFRFARRLELTLQSFTKESSQGLSHMTTSRHGVTLTYGGKTITISYEYGMGDESIRILDEESRDLTDHYIAFAGVLDVEGLENLLIFTQEIDDEDMLTLTIDETVWNFTSDPDLGYLFYTGDGKYDTLEEIPKVDLKGTEHMASGRLYIWSRTLPLLKDYWLTGSGEDTFHLVYPQNDYVGKSIYAGTPLDVIEKPHNTYLLTAIQNGIIPLILFLIFYGVYFVESVRLYGRNYEFEAMDWMGFGVFLSTVCFMVGGIFNDSNINISPLFWSMLGIGIGLNRKIFQIQQITAE